MHEWPMRNGALRQLDLCGVLCFGDPMRVIDDRDGMRREWGALPALW